MTDRLLAHLPPSGHPKVMWLQKTKATFSTPSQSLSHDWGIPAISFHPLSPDLGGGGAGCCQGVLVHCAPRPPPSLSHRGWLGPMEQRCHWTSSRSARLQDLGEEMSSKPAELERALRHGQQLLEMVAGKWGWGGG